MEGPAHCGGSVKVLKAPQPLDIQGKSIFLAGSIEMGKAIDWQTAVTNALADTDCTVLNPRRDDWDSSWEQKITNPQFKEQVMWELTALDKATVIVMYFDPKTMSPISLLELGLYAGQHKLMVVCPEGFWRKGNVEIVCEKYGIQQFNTIEEMIVVAKQWLQPDPEPISKNIYLKKDNQAIGLHAWGYEFNGNFYSEEVWGNEYDNQGQMIGRGSFRVFNEIEAEAKEFEADGWVRYEAP